MLMTVIILVIDLLVTSAEENVEFGYCDASKTKCESQIGNSVSSAKYLFYDVNPPEGFNLRRDVYMRFAIMLSEAHRKGKYLEWILVLPPWYRLYHWKTDRHNEVPLPWGKFFDLESLKPYVSVTEMFKIFDETPSKILEIDTLYILQNYPDPFEGGAFVDKWEINNNHCDYHGNFWGYANITAKEVICVRFQGQATKLWEILLLHPNDRTVMVAHGEIALHDSYGTKTYWHCRRSMKFNRDLLSIADRFIKDKLSCDEVKCKSYMSIHWRRQDFARSRKSDVPSLAGTVSQIQKAFKVIPKVKNIFIATDAPMSELNQLEKLLKGLDFEVFYYMPSPTELNEFRDGGIAIIDQIICSRAAYFIGTHESTFSFRIQEEREILGFNSNTTFNRFCPDKGVCDPPSKWTIVN